MRLADQNARLLVRDTRERLPRRSSASLSRSDPRIHLTLEGPDPRSVASSLGTCDLVGRTLRYYLSTRLDCACAERRSARAYTRNSLRDHLAQPSWGTELAADLSTGP